MIKLNIACTWEEMINRILEAEPKLVPEELTIFEGDDEALVRHLAHKLGRSHEAVTGWVESVAAGASQSNSTS